MLNIFHQTFLFEGDDCRIQRIYEALALETLFAEFKERQEIELLMQNVHDTVNCQVSQEVRRGIFPSEF